MPEQTADVEVVIIVRETDSITYRNVITGKEWRVRGVCERKGLCLLGSVVEIEGEPVQIESIEHLNELCRRTGKERLDSDLDVPIGIGWSNENNCCRFDIEIL